MDENLAASSPPNRDVDVAVIGTGFAGLYSLYKVREELGLDVVAFDNAADVGGTWFWNRYPGARSDTEIFAYCYSFDRELFESWNWSERYPPGPEILSYLQHVADRHDLRRSVRFNTQVTGIAWSEDTQRYTLTTDSGDCYTARFVIEGLGLLSATYKPNFSGMDEFAGEIYHTAQWPHEPVDFIGKRVAVIGTGSSGIQVITTVAPEAAQLTVFQRHAQWVVPARHSPIPSEVMDSILADYDGYWSRLRASNTCFPIIESDVTASSVTPFERQQKFEELWKVGGGFAYMFGSFSDVTTDVDANHAATQVIEAKIRDVIQNPAVAELLVPKELFAKRPLCGDGYYETFNRDNVTLHDASSDPIVKFTVTGLQTRSGEHAFDVIVLATGFDAVSGNQLRIRHTGADGLDLRDAWRNRPRSYLGMMTSGFPNLFMIYGPMGPFTNQPPAHEYQVNWVADAIRFAMTSDVALAPSADAEAEWIARCDETARGSLFSEVKSWINGSNVPGKPVTNMFYMGGMQAYMGLAEEVAHAGYAALEQTPAPAANEVVPS